MSRKRPTEVGSGVSKDEAVQLSLLVDTLNERFGTEFDKAENASKGVLKIEGKMVERLHAEAARRTVAMADAIAARG